MRLSLLGDGSLGHTSLIGRSVRISAALSSLSSGRFASRTMLARPSPTSAVISSAGTGTQSTSTCQQAGDKVSQTRVGVSPGVGCVMPSVVVALLPDLRKAGTVRVLYACNWSQKLERVDALGMVDVSGTGGASSPFLPSLNSRNGVSVEPGRAQHALLPLLSCAIFARFALTFA